MIFGRCSKCCGNCCCVPDANSPTGYSINRTLVTLQQCHEAGGKFTQCPGLRPCWLCQCTPTASVNGVELGPWMPGLDSGAGPYLSPCTFDAVAPDGATPTAQQTNGGAPADPFYGSEAQAVSVTSVGPFPIDGGIIITKFVVTATAHYDCSTLRVTVDSYFSRSASEVPGLEVSFPNGLRSINGPLRIWQFYYDNWNETGEYFCPGGEYAAVESCLYYSIPTNAEADCSNANPPVPGPGCPTIEWMTSVGAGDGLAVVDEMPEVSLSCNVIPEQCGGQP